MKYELRVDLIVIEGVLVRHFFGSLPIYGDLQQHIEMAGRAAALQAYFYMLKELNIQEHKNCGTE